MDKLNEPVIYDVIIVGAGISGSNAGYILKKRCKNLKILIIEGKDRVGGRTLTTEMKCSRKNKTSKWDLGGQWVTDTQRNVTKLLKELNIDTYQQYNTGKKVLEVNGNVSVYNRFVPSSSFFSWLDMRFYLKRVNKIVNRINTLDPYEDLKLAIRLDSTNLEEYMKSKSYTPTAWSICNSNMRAIFGLELSQVNTLFGLMLIKSGGGDLKSITYSDKGCAQEKRVVGGTQQISKKLIEYILDNSVDDSSYSQLLLNTKLLEIIQDEYRQDIPVQVLTENTLTGEKRTFLARKVISSIPINQYSSVRFTPELPYYKRNFFKFCQIGNYIKFILTYKRPFWREKGFSGEGVSDGSVVWYDEKKFSEAYENDEVKAFEKKLPSLGPIAEIYDGTNEENEPALIGFIAAKSAVEWGDQSEEVRRTEIIEAVVRYFGEESRDYIDYVEKNWYKEPFHGGCPSINVGGSGVMKDYARATREPFINVHFCGTESATEWQGYMDGAVESGERVANEIIYCLFKGDKTVSIDFEKTYYYHNQVINENEVKNAIVNQGYFTRLKSLSKYLFRASLLLGASFTVFLRFNKDSFHFKKLLEKFFFEYYR